MDVCMHGVILHTKYYIGPSVACLSVLSSAAAVATAAVWRADRRQWVYDCSAGARSRQVSGHGVILNTAGEAGDVFSRPSYNSPGVPGGGRRHATRLSR